MVWSLKSKFQFRSSFLPSSTPTTPSPNNQPFSNHLATQSKMAYDSVLSQIIQQYQQTRGSWKNHYSEGKIREQWQHHYNTQQARPANSDASEDWLRWRADRLIWRNLYGSREQCQDAGREYPPFFVPAPPFQAAAEQSAAATSSPAPPPATLQQSAEVAQLAAANAQFQAQLQQQQQQIQQMAQQLQLMSPAPPVNPQHSTEVAQLQAQLRQQQQQIDQIAQQLQLLSVQDKPAAEEKPQNGPGK
ncbi:hypothetical protein V8E51_019256 [Hyaloscypha variabilis]